MRPIRLLILLLAIALALGIALFRPLRGHATPAPGPAPKLIPSPVQPVFRPPPAPEPPFGRRVVLYARRFLGVPYSWGGTTPRTGFDCSGFVRFVYQHFGIVLPHSSWGDLARGQDVRRRFLRPGDLVFFYGASHVGIYVGGDRFIDAPHTGTVVRVSTMNEYSGYYGARRFRAG